MDGTNTFASVPAVTVGAGATFDVATTNTAALASVTSLTLGDGARFEVAPTAVSLFGSQATFVRARSSSRFVLPVGSTLRVGYLVVDGVPVAPGVYSSAGDGDSVLQLAQIAGLGMLTVDSLPSGNWWTSANDSSWANADNWSLSRIPDSPTVISTLGSGPLIAGGDDITFNMSGLAPSTSAGDATSTLTIDNGAVLSVQGGRLSITNMCGKVRIGGGDLSVTSRVEVSGGVLNLHATRNNSFAIDKGGLLSLTGGETHFRYYHGNNTNPEWGFRMLGGALEIQDDAYMGMHVTGNPERLFGSGEVRIGGNARLDMTGSGGGRAFWTPAEEGGSLDIDISGNAAVTNFNTHAYLNGYDNRTHTTVNVRGNASLKLPNTTYIGFVQKDGKFGGVDTHGELRISENATVASGANGVFLGSYGSHVVPSSGKVCVSGGVLDLSWVNASAATLPEVRGLAVGYNPYSGGFTNIDNVGVLELSGGAVRNTGSSAFFVVGEGNAKGDFVQTGGEFAHGSKNSYIGWYGGIGRYAFSGDGTANFSNSAVYLGSNGGKGTLEIGAGAGTFTAKSLTVEGSESVVKFIIGAGGSVARLTVNNAFTVDSNAKLVIDATQVADFGSVTLMTFGSRNGEFAAENIEVFAANPDKYRVRQCSDSIRFVQKQGLILCVK